MCEHCSPECAECDKVSALVTYVCWACGKKRCTHCEDCYEAEPEEKEDVEDGVYGFMWFEVDKWLKDPVLRSGENTTKSVKAPVPRGVPITLADFMPT